ncbi:MAG: hypothetical protein FJ009_11205 [Chloroflexi bacterium]|nr:hypothetical protein [Chloroflexota bacterium]
MPIILTCILIASLIACATPLPTHTLAPTFTPSPKPTFTSTPPTTLTASQQYTSAFGIDYGAPEKYLAQGEQTRLSNPKVIDALRGKPQSIAHLGEIHAWIRHGFSAYAAGGAWIGKITTDQLMTERRLSGCHDWGLVYASIARELGYPAVMIDASSIVLARELQAGKRMAWYGHVFVEVFVEGKWVLVDSTNNWYVDQGYDPANSIIPLKAVIPGSDQNTYGYYVMRKGVDTWGYNIRSVTELNNLQSQTGLQLDLKKIAYPPYNLQRFK